MTLHQDAEDPTTGRQEPRPHRLRIGLYEMDDAGALVRTDSVETDVTGARTDVPALAGRPRPALLLVNDDDLSYAKVRLDPRSEATVRSSLSSLTDPMARALCWTALWDSARDAVTPSALYVDAVQRFGPAETGIGVLLNVLGNASTAIERYVPAASGPVSATASCPWRPTSSRGPRRAPTSSWRGRARLPRPAATTTAGWTCSAASWTAARSLTGLSVDAELRWNLWHALAANGHATAEQLDGELGRDNTAAGKSGHATALAARPDAAVKEAAWHEAVHGTSLSNQLLSATIAGFNTGPGSAAAGLRGPLLRMPGGRVGRAQHRDRQPDRPRALPGRRRTSAAARPDDAPRHRPDG